MSDVAEKSPHFEQVRESLGELARTANASIRGYFTQVVYSAIQWLSISDDQVLVVEGREDLDRFFFTEDGKVRRVEEIQVKDLSATINVRSEEVRDSIANFLVAYPRHRKAGKQCLFRFVTTANLKPQRKAAATVRKVTAKGVKLDFQIDVLSSWMSLSSTPQRKKEKLLTQLELSIRTLFIQDTTSPSPEQTAQKLKEQEVSDAIQWIGENSEWSQFFDSVTWSTSQPTLEELIEQLEVEARLSSLWRKLPSPHVTHTLIYHVLRVAAKSSTVERFLTRASLTELAGQSERLLAEWAASVQLVKLADWLGVHEHLATQDQRLSRLETVVQEALAAHNLATDDLIAAHQAWEQIQAASSPSLRPTVFLAGRDAASSALLRIIAGQASFLLLETHFAEEIPHFVTAYLANQSLESVAEKAPHQCFIIASAQAWNRIVNSDTKNCILVADSALDLSGERGAGLIREAIRAGHSVIACGGTGSQSGELHARLPSPGFGVLKDSLSACGFTDARASRLALKSDGRPAVVLRILQDLPVSPAWVATASDDLLFALVLGSWHEFSSADRSVAEKLTGKSYDDWIAEVRKANPITESPLAHSEQVWTFTQRYAGWQLLGRKLYDEYLTRIVNSAVTVLSEVDPRFELSQTERHMAQVQGKTLAHSKHLRRGLAECIALLGTHASAASQCSVGRPEGSAILVVRQLFSSRDWKLWATLGEVLPILAEAAPLEFLSQTETALEKNPEFFVTMCKEEGDGLFGGSLISGLLWALEALAWDSALFTRVATLLAELAEIDPGGRYANRPAQSLSTILQPWYPRTVADPRKCLATVSSILRDLPATGWQLIKTLLPERHGRISIGTHQPVWRDTIPADWQERVSLKAYIEQSNGYFDLAVKAANSPARLAELVEKLDDVDASSRQILLTSLSSLSSEADPVKTPIWEKLEKMIVRHAKYPDTDWALKAPELDKVRAVSEKIKPSDPRLLHKRLFVSSWSELVVNPKLGYEEQLALLNNRQLVGMQEIVSTGGFEAALEFGKMVERTDSAGRALGRLSLNEEYDRDIFALLIQDLTGDAKTFTSGYIRGRFAEHGWAWVDSCLQAHSLSNDQIGRLLGPLPFFTETWDRVSLSLGKDEVFYWKVCDGYLYQAQDEQNFAIEKLIEYGRPQVAIDRLNDMLFQESKVDVGLASRALLGVRESDEPRKHMDEHQITSLIQFLQTDSSTCQDQLFEIEWYYLQLLDDCSITRAKTLWNRMATDPQFFCHLVSLVHEPKGSDPEVGDPEAILARVRLAGHAWSLLNEWELPPSSTQTNEFDGEAAAAWLESVRQISEPVGLLEQSLEYAGQAFGYSPPDPDGLWIHRGAADILNAKHNGALREGYFTQRINSRGAHYIDPTGAPELTLAAEYETKANEVENEGYGRLATTLRELSQFYKSEANRIIA